VIGQSPAQSAGPPGVSEWCVQVHSRVWDICLLPVNSGILGRVIALDLCRRCCGHNVSSLGCQDALSTV